MELFERKIKNLISPLFQDYGYEMIPAEKNQLVNFEKKAINNQVPREAIFQLKKFYRVVNGIDPSLDSLSIHRLNDSIIYEFWKDNGQLWIGQRDMDIISWKDGSFHLGCVGYLNYGQDYIFTSLLALLEKGFKEWYIESGGKYPYATSNKIDGSAPSLD